MIEKSFWAGLVAASLIATATPAMADPPPWAPAHGWRDKQDREHRYRDGRRYYRERQLAYNDRVWRGRDGRYHCRRSDGTTGLIVGGAVGALLGRELDGGRERTLGTVLGAAGGALIGKSVDSGLKCR